MPMFTFRCPEPECAHAEERLVRSGETREAVGAEMRCPEHEVSLTASGIESPVIGRDTGKGRVVLANGERVRGEFVSNRRG